ncbi:MAG: hypothetical protein HRU19_27985 [Pseudobacteriovorax sp.]|nr:hypothetical protein [Pseudobacteriovorax sp.]
MKRLTIVGLVVWQFSCKPADDKSKTQLVIDSCSQNPVSLYMDEKQQGVRLYKFGDHDAAFRATIERLLVEYQKSGKDIDGKQKYQLMKKYVPLYLEKCFQLFSPLVETCKDYPIGTKEFDGCTKDYKKAYGEAFENGFRNSGSHYFNIEKISLK